jgi:uncharacterized protein (TIGR03435 family)
MEPVAKPECIAIGFNPDESAPSIDQALKEQLGIKMVSKKGPASVVDHIEHPSPN